MSDKFKNCFADHATGFQYPITLNGEKFATARTLTPMAQVAIRRDLGITLRDMAENPEQIDPIAYMIVMISHALIEWEHDLPITIANVDLLTTDALKEIYNQILEHESAILETAEDNEKN